MVIYVREAKGGVPREIPLSPVLLDRLRVYFRWRRPTDWLFPSKQRPDLPLDDASIRVLCRKAGHRAGIGRRVHPHLFRHACATHMLDAGADLRTIQVLLGHGDIRTTAKYLRVSLQRLQSIKSPFDTLNVKALDRSEDDGRQNRVRSVWKLPMSSGDTTRSSLRNGAAISLRNSGRYSGISAPVARGRVERASSNATSAPTKRCVSTRAAIATVRVVNPARETAG